MSVQVKKRNIAFDRLKDKPEKVEETKESIKTVIEEAMQNEIELTKNELQKSIRETTKMKTLSR